MDEKCEFYKALYWMFEGRIVRLTTYGEREFNDATLTQVAFERARLNNLTPTYMRIFVGQFLRNTDEAINDHALDKGVFLYV